MEVISKYIIPISIIVLISIYLLKEKFINASIVIDPNNIQKWIPFNAQKKPQPNIPYLPSLKDSSLEMTSLTKPIHNINNPKLLESRQSKNRNPWIRLE